ncbi:hypothetical protein EMCRGX_G019431 [Ephydatia muelleri]
MLELRVICSIGWPNSSTMSLSVLSWMSVTSALGVDVEGFICTHCRERDVTFVCCISSKVIMETLKSLMDEVSTNSSPLIQD